jgi:hypothetical protein
MLSFDISSISFDGLRPLYSLAVDSQIDKEVVCMKFLERLILDGLYIEKFRKIIFEKCVEIKNFKIGRIDIREFKEMRKYFVDALFPIFSTIV